MKAVVKYEKGYGKVKVMEMNIPEINDDEVLIKVKAVSICGSDLHIYHDAHYYFPPVILGHEFSGIIEKVGNKVKNWKKGDAVVSETSTGVCGECYYCKSGNRHLCPEKKPPGIGLNGAYTSYVKVPAVLLHKKPDNITFEEAAMVEPTAVCVHGLYENIKIKPGDVVVISGAGPIGLISLLLSKIAGASYIIVSGTPRSADLKLKKALDLGADRVVNIGKEVLSDVVKEVTNGLGADIAIETSGSEKAIKDVFDSVRRDGTICCLGISGKEYINVPWDKGIFKSVKVIFSFSSKWTSWETTLKLLKSGKLKLEPLITHRFSILEWEKAFKLMEEGKAIKIILYPEDEK